MGRTRVIEAGFVARLTEAHKGKLQYLFGFSGMNEKVHVICLDCGYDWWGKACGLVEKSKPKGCKKCYHRRRSKEKILTKEQHINNIFLAHGDDVFLKGDFINTKVKTEYGCVKCNETFKAIPSDVTRKKGPRGCPTCAKYGFDPNAPAICYYLRVSTQVSGELYKIGITNKSVEKRFYNYDLEKITTVKTWDFNTGSDAKDMEDRIKKQYADDRYTGEDVLGSNGNTEMFTRDILGLDHNLCP